LKTNREELQEQIHALNPWFHFIDLGDGLLTKTSSISGEPVTHPLGTWEIIRRCIPENLCGMAVLDVGCNDSLIH
jgi:hypothetical protein